MAVHDDPGPTLVEAAAWIARFSGRHVVVKLGGELLEPPILGRLAPQIAVLHACGLHPVVVHGAGRQLDEACRARGLAIEKVGGRRRTTVEVRDALVDVAAELNEAILTALRAAGVPAHGFADGVSHAVRCERRRDPEYDWGEVGDVVGFDPEHLRADAPRSIPVLPSLGDGGGWLNVNADSVARAAAVGLQAEKLVLLTGVAGVLQRIDDAGPISRMRAVQARGLIERAVVEGGMKAKIEEGLLALEAGVPKVHVLSGRLPMTLLREIFTDDGCGTLLLP